MITQLRTHPAWRSMTNRLPQHLLQPPGSYMAGILLMVIAIALGVSVIGPTPLVRQMNLAIAIPYLLLLAVYVAGLSLRTTLYAACALGLTYLLASTLTEGHIFSSNLVWLLLIPLTVFYIVGPRAGRQWMLLVALAHVLVAAVAWGWGGQLPRLYGDDLSTMSLIDYLFAAIALMLVPNYYQQDYENNLQVQQLRQRKLQAQQVELEHIQQMQEDFIASVSHELRTPMNAILGLNALLLERVQQRPQACKVLEYTRQSADHLMTVINDVLDYSQMHLGQFTSQAQRCDLHETVHAAFDLFQPRIENTRLRYECELAPDVPRWVLTDRHRLMQVLVNLLGNAIKFTHRGSVRLRVSKTDAGICFEVQDTGIGIAKDQQTRIFERFSQADAGIQRRYGGTGLGLTISQRLVTLLGGQLQLESHEGLGSRFWFSLPLQGQTPPQPAPPPPALSGVQAPQALRFLIVDDHPVNRLLVRQILQRHWPRAVMVEALDGAQALQALQGQDRFDLVLMDMVMPVMDGIEATRAIRVHALAAVRGVPVLGLTANVNTADLQRFSEAGLDGLLLKPFEIARLCAEVERLTRKVTAQAAVARTDA